MANSQVIRDEITSLHEAGKSATYIIAIVADGHNVSESQVRKELQSLQLTAKPAQDLEALVRTMRENNGKGLKREELVKLMSEESGYSESTANHMLSQLNFAKEYAKQVNS